MISLLTVFDRVKFKQGIKSLAGAKRKREADDDGSGDGSADDSDGEEGGEITRTTKPSPKKVDAKKKKNYGPKQPNPLSIKKAKREGEQVRAGKSDDALQKKKRKRKSKNISKQVDVATEAAASTAEE